MRLKIKLNQTQTLFSDKNLSENDFKILNDLRQRQLETLEQVQTKNLLSVKLNESKWMLFKNSVIQNETLTFEENLEIFKKSVIVNDYVLIVDKSFKSGKLCIVHTAKKI